jgi:MFS family permease
MVKISRDGRWSALVCVLISFLCGLSVQTSGIFLPIFAGDIGASKLQIGVIGGLYGAAYLVSSLFFGRQSDLRGRLLFIRLGLGLAALGYAAQELAGTPLALILIRTLLGFCVAISDAALMAYNFEVVGKTGRFASLSALGWLSGGTIAIFYHNYHGLFLLSSIACAAAFLVSWSLAREENHHPQRPALIQMIHRNARVYLPFLLRNVGGNMVWFIFPLFLTGLGATMSWVAILQCMNNAAQFVMMIWADRIKANHLFIAGLLLSAVAFIIYAQARNYVQIIPAQLILAASWSALYIGSLLLLFKDNQARATSASVLFSTGSLSQAVGPFMGGFVVQLWGYQPLMYVASIFCLAGAGFAAVPNNPGDKNQGGTQSARR